MSDTTLSVESNTAFSETIKNYLAKGATHITPNVTAGNLFVTFYDVSYVESTWQLLSGFVPGLKRHGDVLVAKFENCKQAKLQSNDIDSILYEYDEGLLSSSYHQNWLEDFNNKKRHGIDVVYVKQLHGESDTLDSMLKDRISNQEKQSKYMQDKTSARDKAVVYSAGDFSDHIAEVVYSSWSGFDNQEHVRDIIIRMLPGLRETSKRTVQFKETDVSDHIRPIKKRAEYLMQAKLTSQDHYSAIRDGYSKEEALRKRLQTTEAHDVWQRCTSLVKIKLREYTNDIQLRDTPLECDPKMIDFSYSREDFVKRLSARWVRFMMEDQGYEAIELLAGGIAGYYLSILGVKQSEKFKRELIQLSKTLDKTSFFDSMTPLLERSLIVF